MLSSIDQKIIVGGFDYFKSVPFQLEASIQLIIVTAGPLFIDFFIDFFTAMLAS